MVENSRNLPHKKVTLPKKDPYSRFFWPVFCRIQTEQGEIQSTVSVRIRENTDQKTPNTNTCHAVLVLQTT